MPGRKTTKKKTAATKAKKKLVAKKKPASKTAKRPSGKKAATTVKRKTSAAPRLAKKTKKATAPAKKKTAKRAPGKKAATATRANKTPAPRPSERALAASAQLPSERSLSDDERDALSKVADTARRFLDAVGGPDAVVYRIHAFVDEVRGGKVEDPKSQDVRLGLGALWGEQLRAQVGWVWVHLTYPDGFASYALVPDDRAFACFPLNRVQELMGAGVRANTTVAIFNSIVAGTLPATRRANAYLVIG